jgi:signal transduction histidine kinase
MKSGFISITRRIVVTVLVLEVLSALALIAATAVREHHLELKAFDATLIGTADSLMGAVQDAEDENDNVVLDLRDVHLGRNAIYRIEDGSSLELGSKGDVMPAFRSYSSAPGFHNTKIAGRLYRLYVIHGTRVIDPGKPTGGVTHHIIILYGLPLGHVWHEVLEATRFFILATVLLLSITTAVMVWLVKKHLSPVHELAREADSITSHSWSFEAPASAKESIELRPLTNALEAALARLQRSFEQQRRFTSDAAHELKTDVAIVKSSLQLLSMRKRTPEEYSQGLALSLDDFARLEETVQRMLTLARLEQAPGAANPEVTSVVCSLREVVEEAIHQSSSLAKMKAIHMLFDVGTNASIPLDRRDALLLCSNVLLNALQHSRQDGIVHIGLTPEGPNICMTVRDHGEGIPGEDLPFLFEPFYRGDPSRSRKSGGTGLGLSICKAICNLVNGSIAISNHSDGGTLVKITLPMAALQVDEGLSAPIKAI